MKYAFILSVFCLLNLLVPLQASAAGNSVYIAVRTDGSAGTGTQSDPFDGSTERKFDALMAAFPANTQIHLGAGTFATCGYSAFTVKAGWNISGQGMGTTTLKLVPAATEPSFRKYYHLCGFGCEGVQVSNLTCDGNHQGASWPAHDSVGGICPFGNNVVIDSVEFVNCYGDLAAGLEQFCVVLGGTDPRNLATGCTVRNCRTHHFAPGANYTNGVMISYSTGGSILNCTDDGSNHGFGFSGETNATISGCTSTTQTAKAFYTDTGAVDHITIENNSFSSTENAIQFNSASATSVTIKDNALESSNSNGYGAGAILLTGASGSGFDIVGNVFTYTGTGGNGLILNNAARFTDLDVEDNSSNVGLIGAGGNDSDVTSVATTFSGNEFNLSVADLPSPGAAPSNSSNSGVAATTSPASAAPPAGNVPTPVNAPVPANPSVSAAEDSPQQLARQVQSDTDAIVQQGTTPSVEPAPVVPPAPVSVPAAPGHPPVAAAPVSHSAATNPVATGSSTPAVTSGALVESLPTGPLRDAALQTLTRRVAKTTPAKAAAFAGEISNAALQRAELFSVLQIWMRRDSAQASVAVQNSSLPRAMKNALLGVPE